MRTMLLKAAAFGAGFALILVVLAMAVLWRSSRQDQEPPWNSTAFKASLSDIDVWQNSSPPWEKHQKTQAPTGGTLEFTYIVENRSGKDYRTNGDSVVVMVHRPDGLATSENAITVKYPIFIPAGEKVAVGVSIPYGDILGSVDKNTDLRKVVREKLPKLSGFVLFDQANRYQIELPKDW